MYKNLRIDLSTQIHNSEHKEYYVESKTAKSIPSLRALSTSSSSRPVLKSVVGLHEDILLQ